jgi:hypothetical protein
MSELKKARVDGEQTEVIVNGGVLAPVAPVSPAAAASPSVKTRPCKGFFSPAGCRFWCATTQSHPYEDDHEARGFVHGGWHGHVPPKRPTAKP